MEAPLVTLKVWQLARLLVLRKELPRVLRRESPSEQQSGLPMALLWELLWALMWGLTSGLT